MMARAGGQRVAVQGRSVRVGSVDNMVKLVRLDTKVIRLNGGSYTASLFDGEDKRRSWTDDERTGPRCAILNGRRFAGIGEGV